jgi:hypothetical protein
MQSAPPTLRGEQRHLRRRAGPDDHVVAFVTNVELAEVAAQADDEPANPAVADEDVRAQPQDEPRQPAPEA